MNLQYIVINLHTDLGYAVTVCFVGCFGLFLYLFAPYAIVHTHSEKGPSWNFFIIQYIPLDLTELGQAKVSVGCSRYYSIIKDRMLMRSHSMPIMKLLSAISPF